MFGAAGTFIKTSQYAQNQGKVCCTIGVHTIVTVVDGLLCAKPTRYHIDTWDEMMMERDKRLTGHKRGQKVCSWIDSYELCTTNYAMFFFFSQTQFRLKDSRLVASGLQSQHNNLFAHCFINLTVACFPPLFSLSFAFIVLHRYWTEDEDYQLSIAVLNQFQTSLLWAPRISSPTSTNPYLSVSRACPKPTSSRCILASSSPSCEMLHDSMTPCFDLISTIYIRPQ